MFTTVILATILGFTPGVQPADTPIVPITEAEVATTFDATTVCDSYTGLIGGLVMAGLDYDQAVYIMDAAGLAMFEDGYNESDPTVTARLTVEAEQFIVDDLHTCGA